MKISTKITKANIAALLVALKENVDTLAQRTSGLQEEQLQAQPSEGEWSLAQVITHLRACSELWTYSVYAMLAEETPTLFQIHPNRWQAASTATDTPFQLEFRIYRYQRDKLIAVLNEQSLEIWQCTATIGDKEHSVYSQVRRMVLHEQEHQTQIENIARTLLK